MKRFTAAILVVLLICSALNLTVLASGTSQTRLSVSSAKAEPGDNITVNVSLHNNPGIISACINVSFDSGLTLIGAKNGNVFPSSITFMQPKQLSSGNPITGNCNFAWSGTDIKDKDIKDGIMLIMTFTVSSKAKNGDSYGITVTTRKGDFVDKKLSIVEIGAVESQVTVLSENAEIDSDEISEKSFRSIVDWLKRLIAMIKSLFSKIGKI